MENINNIQISGYIEGYYGRLLNWKDRKLIIHSLKKNNMNTYLYAPKEDLNHRLNWRDQYSSHWRKNFRSFTNYSKNNNIDIIAGIAPGLDFNFKNIDIISNKSDNSDLTILFNKAKQLIDDGANSIALLLDDIPDNFKKKFGDKISEGTYHAILANKLAEKLNQNIYFVPRIYADELINDEPNYLTDLSIVINPKNRIFYCGKNVISKNLSNYSKIKKILNNQIIYWDNYYANDYCPRRFFIGPYVGRKRLTNFMINPTGLINTDLLILDLVGNSINQKNSLNEWQMTLTNHGVPSIFNVVKNFFLKPDFGSKPSLTSLEVNFKHLEALEFLLWKWKSELSREWYPFLFGLKHDLQLYQNTLTSDRIIKTQTLPLSQCISKI